ncbi:MAG TPA: CPBP family intramembrane glutamic endopeptidase [Azospirillaceae bacterium]|nr:CPBP family intramembrane glutamic endopeptidase [Azospirillaceae bacterium]
MDARIEEPVGEAVHRHPYLARGIANGERFTPYFWGTLGAVCAFLVISVLIGIFVMKPLGLANAEAHAGPLFLLAAFMCMGAVALVLAAMMRPLHRRSWRTLISADGSLSPGLLLRAFLLWGAILGAAVTGAALATGEPLQIDWSLALRTVAITGAAVFLQVSAEEMLFRGYMSQGLYLLFRGAVGPAIVVALPFALGHATTHVGLPTFALLAGLSLFLSAVTWRADRLEPAIGVHFAQNMTTLFLAGADGLSGPELLNAEGVTTAQWASVVFFVPAAALFWFLAFKVGLVMKR